MSTDDGIEKTLLKRSGSKCELCGLTENLSVYPVPPDSREKAEDSILVCNTCRDQIDYPKKVIVNHWRCLNDSIWSQVPAVQVVSWRMITRLNTSHKNLRWTQDLLDIIYLEEKTLAWAKATGEGLEKEEKFKHKDCNGGVLEAGDTVILTKDLNIKGANFTAKRGTTVRAILLVSNNTEYIEGKINGQKIVIMTRFVKKIS